jgi:3'-5' exoribonuclease
MAGTDSSEFPVVRLSDLEHGQEAECFAALVKKVSGHTYKNEPYLKCIFRDKRATLEAPIWSDNRFFQQAPGWSDGAAYRLRVRGELSPRYGMQLILLDIRLAGPEDVPDGYDFYDLVESTDKDPEKMLRTVHDCLDKYVVEPHLRQLVLNILREHGELFRKMQAAANFHHSYTGGLLEHVWSMTRIAGFVADHYAKYYVGLNPPLDKGVVVAAAILHDIGKLRELEYHPVEAKYTTLGCLIGHVQMGRDLVRDQARRIEGFPEETLMLLEHAILAHHGKKEFGAPVLPQTIEALIVSFVDDLDAKVNIAARERLRDGEGEFTDKVYALEGRRFYRGIRVDEPADGLVPGC